MILYFAGAGTDPSKLQFTELYRKKHCFTSFWDLTSKHFKTLLDQNPKSVVCDSGAFAFFSRTDAIPIKGNLKSKKIGDIDPKKYVEDYCKWIEETRGSTDYFIELDTQELHGKLFKDWQRSAIQEVAGAKMIPVWHKNETEKDWQELCDKYAYIAIEGLNAGRMTTADYLAKMKVAWANKTKVHIFGTLKQSLLERVPFYSADASTSTMIWRYGARNCFVKDKFYTVSLVGTKQNKSFNPKKVDVGSFDKWLNMSLTNECFKDPEMTKLLYESFDAQVQYENYLTRLWARRGFVWD